MRLNFIIFILFFFIILSCFIFFVPWDKVYICKEIREESVQQAHVAFISDCGASEPVLKYLNKKNVRMEPLLMTKNSSNLLSKYKKEEHCVNYKNTTICSKHGISAVNKSIFINCVYKYASDDWINFTFCLKSKTFKDSLNDEICLLANEQVKLKINQCVNSEEGFELQLEDQKNLSLIDIRLSPSIVIGDYLLELNSYYISGDVKKSDFYFWCYNE